MRLDPQWGYPLGGKADQIRADDDDRMSASAPCRRGRAGRRRPRVRESCGQRLSSSYSSGLGVLTLFTTLIGVPLIALVMVIALRLALEAGVALIAVAENTGRKAADPDTKS